MEKIGIIGAGHMGSAFYRALAQEFKENMLYVCDLNQEKLDVLNALHITIYPNKLIESADVIILAIKPQSFSELIDSVSVSMSNKLIISIMAGVSIQKITEMAGTDKVVRAMPNLGTQIRQGVTGWFASDGISNEDKDLVEKIFFAGGESIEVKDEKMIDRLAAISGSGPAYYFYLTELLQKKAEDLGFSSNDAKKMAEMTFVGSAELFDESNKTAEEWREAVCSKGGSTIEAIKSLQENRLDEILSEAVDKAIKRWEDFNI